MIRFHGGPFSNVKVARDVWTARHACVSFADPKQCALAFEVAQSVMLDNGAFSSWNSGVPFDFEGYVAFVRVWERHPAFAFCCIPDVIDGGEEENDRMLARWFAAGMRHGMPVFHLHESPERLRRLAHDYRAVALGSSGTFADVGTAAWWSRMDELMPVLVDTEGCPTVRIHGLRMLNPTVFSHLPLHSADSTNVARNATNAVRWTGPYVPVSEEVRGLVMADRIDRHACAARWSSRHGVQQNMELVG